MKSNRITELKSIHFSSVLYQFYISNSKDEKLEKLSYSLFSQLKEDNVVEQTYWDGVFPLFHSLLILHKNEFIDADLSNVLLEYDLCISNSLLKNRCIDSDFLPFYTKILLNRIDSAKDMNLFCIALIQSAEKFIQYFNQRKYELHKERYHYHLLSLLDIYRLNLYREAILPIFETYIEVVEESTFDEDLSKKMIYYNNTSVYPLLCEVLNRRQQFDWSSQAKELLTLSLNLESIDLDYFYFINALRAFAYKQSDKYKWKRANDDFKKYLSLAKDIPLKCSTEEIRQLNADEAYLFDFSFDKGDEYRNEYRDCRVLLIHKRNVGSIIIKYYFKPKDKVKIDNIIKSSFNKIGFKDQAFFNRIGNQAYPY